MLSAISFLVVFATVALFCLDFNSFTAATPVALLFVFATATGDVWFRTALAWVLSFATVRCTSSLANDFTSFCFLLSAIAFLVVFAAVALLFCLDFNSFTAATPVALLLVFATAAGAVSLVSLFAWVLSFATARCTSSLVNDFTSFCFLLSAIAFLVVFNVVVLLFCFDFNSFTAATPVALLFVFATAAGTVSLVSLFAWVLSFEKARCITCISFLVNDFTSFCFLLSAVAFLVVFISVVLLFVFAAATEVVSLVSMFAWVLSFEKARCITCISFLVNDFTSFCFLLSAIAFLGVFISVALLFVFATATEVVSFESEFALDLSFEKVRCIICISSLVKDFTSFCFLLSAVVFLVVFIVIELLFCLDFNSFSALTPVVLVFVFTTATGSVSLASELSWVLSFEKARCITRISSSVNFFTSFCLEVTVLGCFSGVIDVGFAFDVSLAFFL